jgi:integrase
MGIKHKLNHQLIVANRQLGGARGTRAARLRHGRAFIRWHLEHSGGKISSLRDINPSVLGEYVRHLQPRLAAGSIHTYLGSVRQLLKAAGVELAGFERNAAIGAKPRSRIGTKLPFPEECLPALLQEAKALDAGMYHLLQIERLLGVRGLEALMASDSIKGWIDEIAYLSSVHVTRGTKGGRRRYTDVLAGRVEETRQALAEALEYIRENKFFITTKNGGLGPARQRYHRLARKLGLVGQYSPHSLRYAWACEKACELVAAGLDRNAILSFLSLSLGHGSTRGRWAKLVYARKVMHLLPRPTRRAQQLYEFVMTLHQLQSAPNPPGGHRTDTSDDAAE